MRVLVESSAPELLITQDLGIGMMLWMTHFFPKEPWAQIQRPRCLSVLERMWEAERYTLPEGYLRDRLAVILRHAGVLLQWHSLSGRRLHLLRGRAPALRERCLGAQRVVLRLTTLPAVPS
jgi:hypothetical protein